MEFEKTFKLVNKGEELREIIKETERRIKEVSGVRLTLEIKEYHIEAFVEGITRVVADKLGVTISSLLSNSRRREVVEARQIAMLLALRYIPGATLLQVAKYFNRDHTTVIHSVAKVKTLLGVGDEMMTHDFSLCQQAVLEKLNN